MIDVNTTLREDPENYWWGVCVLGIPSMPCRNSSVPRGLSFSKVFMLPGAIAMLCIYLYFSAPYHEAVITS